MRTCRLDNGIWALGLLIVMAFPSQSRGQYRGQIVSAGGRAPALTFSTGLPVSGQSTLFSTRLAGDRGHVGSDVELSEAVPTKFLLNQNYPNPFRTATTSQFGLPVEAYVTIEIVNLLGQVVSIPIADAFKNAGYHSVAWDIAGSSGAALSSGVYMYRMSIYSGSKHDEGSLQFKRTQYMIVIR